MPLHAGGRSLLAAAGVGVLATWAACSSGSKTPGQATIGAEGGTVSLPGGAQVVVPKGAVATAATLSIEKVSTGAPAQPGTVTARGDVYALTPHGQAFGAPVQVSIPFSGSADPSLQLMTAQPGGSWSVVPGATQRGTAMEAEVNHFSFFQVVAPDAGDAGGGREGAINGSWLIIGFVCDGGSFDAGQMPPTTFTIDGGTGVVTNQYCTVPLTLTYPAPGQVDWVVGASVCPGFALDGGQTDCKGTHHPSTWVIEGSTLTLTEAPAPVCEYYCGGLHKVTTFQGQ